MVWKINYIESNYTEDERLKFSPKILNIPQNTIMKELLFNADLIDEI